MVIKLYEAGEPRKSITRITGVSNSTVGAMLKAAGIQPARESTRTRLVFTEKMPAPPEMSDAMAANLRAELNAYLAEGDYEQASLIGSKLVNTPPVAGWSAFCEKGEVI